MSDAPEASDVAQPPPDTASAASPTDGQASPPSLPPPPLQPAPPPPAPPPPPPPPFSEFLTRRHQAALAILALLVAASLAPWRPGDTWGQSGSIAATAVALTCVLSATALIALHGSRFTGVRTTLLLAAVACIAFLVLEPLASPGGDPLAQLGTGRYLVAVLVLLLVLVVPWRNLRLRPEPWSTIPRHWQDEDLAAVIAAPFLLLASLAPWYPEEPFNAPRSWDEIALFVAGLSVYLALLALRGPANARIRRVTWLVVGGISVLLLANTEWTYYSYHAAVAPKMGVLGHLAYIGLGVHAGLAAAALLAWAGIATKRPEPAQPPRHVPVERRLRWIQRVGIPLLVFLCAYSVYDDNLGHPAIIDFDEAHYVRVAMNITDGVIIDPSWGEPRPFNFEHPPVGKYLIALGYWLYDEPHDNYTWPQYYGDDAKPGLCKQLNEECTLDARSWRFGSVLMGSLGVVGMYWIGLRLFKSVAVGLVSALFLLLDNMYYLHSRVAMLDIFPIAFALLAFGVYLGPRRWHPWAGSVLFGLAAASKHTALFLLPLFLLLVFLTSVHVNRWMRLRDALIRGLILPFAIYLLAYLPYLIRWAQEGGLHGHDGLEGAIEMFIYVHQEAFRWTYRADVLPHPYVSDPETWIPMRRPVLYYVSYKDFPLGQHVGHIYALGNPFLWWIGSVAVLYGAFAAVLRFALGRPRLGLVAFWQWIRRPFAMTTPQAHILATLLFLTAFLPFFILQRDPFNFYFLIACPFLSLVLAGHVGALIARRGAPRLFGLLVVALAVFTFAFYSPVSDGTWLMESDFQTIMKALPCPGGPDAFTIEPCMKQ